MRTVKFRVWDSKAMHLPEYSDEKDFYLTPKGELKYLYESRYESRLDTGWYNENFVAMQFTGHKDINGVYVYEGDVITRSEVEGKVIYVVEWSDDKLGWMCTDVSDKFHTEFLYDYSDDEVIGNIYQNPELLK